MGIDDLKASKLDGDDELGRFDGNCDRHLDLAFGRTIAVHIASGHGDATRCGGTLVKLFGDNHGLVHALAGWQTRRGIPWGHDGAHLDLMERELLFREAMLEQQASHLVHVVGFRGPAQCCRVSWG